MWERDRFNSHSANSAEAKCLSMALEGKDGLIFMSNQVLGKARDSYSYGSETCDIYSLIF